MKCLLPVVEVMAAGAIHFKTPSNQAPRIANKGQPGEEKKLKLEMSIMADIGLVGFPNAGKSTLLDAFTNARPKIAPYPFTTKIPNLGVLRADETRDVVIADIPGIIEGASDGKGLGIRFLKHISRTAGLLFMIDCSDENCFTAYDTLCSELAGFSKDLILKKRIVLCNKIDVEGAEQRAEELKAKLLNDNPDEKVLFMSVYERKGLGNVQKAIISLVEENFKKENERFASISGETALNREGKTKKSEFMKNRASCSAETTQYPGSEQGSGF